MVKKAAPARIVESVGTHHVTRRTVTRGIAWTTPVVAIATAAPAFAASCEIDLEVDADRSCKDANSARYRLFFNVVGNCLPPGCTARITEVRESTGQGRVLFASQAGVVTGPIVICDANNLSAFVTVTADISCDDPDLGLQQYEVKANQFTNAASVCEEGDFAVCSTP